MKEPSSTLDTLQDGAVARIAGLADLPDGLADRLIELGFDRGATVERLNRAPWGDPIAVRVDGTVVALRRRLARAVLLEPGA